MADKKHYTPEERLAFADQVIAESPKLAEILEAELGCPIVFEYFRSDFNDRLDEVTIYFATQDIAEYCGPVAKSYNRISLYSSDGEINSRANISLSLCRYDRTYDDELIYFTRLAYAFNDSYDYEDRITVYRLFFADGQWELQKALR